MTPLSSDWAMDTTLMAGLSASHSLTWAVMAGDVKMTIFIRTVSAWVSGEQ